MTVHKDGQAPYTSLPALMTVIDRFRHRTPETPVTTDVLQMMGIKSTIAPRTLQSLKLLDLLDDEGNPTEALIGLREAPPEELPARLGAVVRSAYAEVFAYRDPATDPPEQIVEAFRMYEPASMRARMVRLFYGLCKEAGLITELPAIPNAPAGTTIIRRTRPRSKPDKGRDGDESAKRRAEEQQRREQEQERLRRQEEERQQNLGTQLPQQLHPALVGLLKLIPAEGQAWKSRERYDTFKAAWDATLAATNPIDDGSNE